MLRWLFLLFSIVWSSLLSSILAGSVYDMKNDKWDLSASGGTYPGGLAVIKKISSVYNLNLIIKDHLTNTRAVVDVNDGCSGPTYEAQYDYYPYSKILRKQETPRSRFQSTDHETDLETGYNNRNARWYDDESFQFLQVDPVSDVYPSLTPYNYVGRNPILKIDPTGMYETQADAEANRQSAMRLGYKVDDVYKSGDEYVFNFSGVEMAEFATAKSRDFVEAVRDLNSPPKDAISKALGYDRLFEQTRLNEVSGGYTSKSNGGLAEPPLSTFDLITLGQGGKSLFNMYATWQASKNGSTILYRAVSKAELDDIAANGVRNSSGYETGKLFATSLDDAARFGKNNFKFDGVENFIIKVKVPNSVYNNAFKFETDLMKAISIPSEHLKHLNATPLNYYPWLRP